jgi:hypothetical protein
MIFAQASVLFRGLNRNDGALKAARYGYGCPASPANQVPVEPPVFAYIGQSACQAARASESSTLA